MQSTRFEQRTFKELARRFSPKFATLLIRSSDWQALASDDAWYVVRLVGKSGGDLPPLSELAPRLTLDWQRANRGSLSERALQRIRKDYVFVDGDATGPRG